MNPARLIVALFALWSLLPGAAFADSGKVPFDVGLILPLSGNAAEYGIAIQNSIEMARKDKPELFTNIRFHYEDAAFDPKMALLALNKLIDQDKVDIVVTWGVVFCKTLAPVAEARKEPMLAICLDPKVGKDRRYVIRFKNPIDDMMRVQAKYLFDHGMKRIGILLAQHPYLQEAYEALGRHLMPGQTLQLIGKLPVTDSDLRTYLLKLKQSASDYDVVGTFVFIGQVPLFYRQAQELKIDLPTFGTDIFESLSEIRAANGTMNGVVFTSIEIKEEFFKRYKEIYKNESQLSFGAPAYELAMTVGRVFNSLSAEISHEEVLSKLAAVPPQDGVASGPYRYINSPEYGQYFEFPVVTKRIQGETFEVLR